MNHGNISATLAKGLKALRSRIDKANIPSSKLDETLNIATWNIREFGKVKRTEAAVHYIAEILGQFDLISLVELRDNLSDLRRVFTLCAKLPELLPAAESCGHRSKLRD